MSTIKFFMEFVAKEQATMKALGVQRIGIFGSCARGKESKHSDIDVLVEFEQNTFDNYMELKFLLEEGMGRKVDLVTIGALKPTLKDEILREVRYAA